MRGTPREVLCNSRAGDCRKVAVDIKNGSKQRRWIKNWSSEIFLDGYTVDTDKSLTSINLWCRNNKLTPHTVKSEVVILTHKPFCGPLKPVMLGNKVLDFGTETKCSGIIIDNQLTWLSHIELICSSFSESKSAKRAQIFNNRYLTVYLLYKYYTHRHLLQFSLGYLLTYIIAWSGEYPRQGSQDYL